MMESGAVVGLRGPIPVSQSVPNHFVFMPGGIAVWAGLFVNPYFPDRLVVIADEAAPRRDWEKRSSKYLCDELSNELTSSVLYMSAAPLPARLDNNTWEMIGGSGALTVMAQLARLVAERLDADRRIVFLGAGEQGFTAAQLAVRARRGRVVVENPVLDRRRDVEDLPSALRPVLGSAAVETQPRNSAVFVASSVQVARHLPSVKILVNVTDDEYDHGHIVSFVNRMKTMKGLLSPGGSVDLKYCLAEEEVSVSHEFGTETLRSVKRYLGDGQW